MSKILVIGDPHFRVEHLSTVDIFCEQITQMCADTAYDFVVVLGDVLHNHEKINSTVLNKAVEFFENLCQKTKVFVLVGNHDMIDNSQFLNDKHWMNCLKGRHSNLTVVDKVVDYLHNDEELYVFCPYVPVGRFEEALDTYPEWKEALIVFAHQEIKGSSVAPKIVSTKGDTWCEEFPLLISGHIHHKQKIGENVIYTGSSMATSFSDCEQKYVLEFDTESFTETYIPLNIPVKTTKTIDITELDAENETFHNPNQRLVVEGDSEDLERAKGQIKLLEKKGVKIVKRVKTEKPVTESQTENKSEINFYQMLMKTISTQPNAEQLRELYEKIQNLI